MAATPAVSVRLITRAPLLKIVRLVNQTNWRVPLLKDTVFYAIRPDETIGIGAQA